MITKKIWTYWHQGWGQAPSLVKQCKTSWDRLNPDYEMYALDHSSLFDHIDFPVKIDIKRKDLTIQKISALGRLALLSKYGGVWTDATVMCTRPLSEWLEEYYGSQFFAFRSPGKDRLMSNWFVAAEAESVIIQRMYKNFSDFFANNYFSNQNTILGRVLLKFFNRCWNADFRTTIKWHSWFARRVLRICPYFISLEYIPHIFILLFVS
ncbi:MAG: capsular polysaccharide synthesis protein [Thermodesulfobacteriota bacterium]|nr:capsular polysaccharide synthesis protein [Thermodesulfobacteriota bacterium]